MSVALNFPSVAQLQMQSFVGDLLGRPVLDSEITAFSSRAREVQPKLTDRTAMVLYALSHSAKPITVKHLPLTPTVLWVVLHALHDLNVVEITGERWRAEVALTDAGVALVQDAHHG